MSRLVISGGSTLFLGYRPAFVRTLLVRNTASDSKPPSEHEEQTPPKYLLTPVKKFPPRVTRLSFNSRWLKAKGLHNHSYKETDETAPTLYNLPIFETREHIFPGFEKIMKKADPLLSIISDVAPSSKTIALFTQKDNYLPCPELNHLYRVGTLASYETWPYSPDNSPHVILKSHNKIKFLNTSVGKLNNISYADCRIIVEKPTIMTPELRIVCYQVIEAVRRLLPYFRYHSVGEQLNSRVLDPLYWSYCAPDFTMSYETSRLQSILEEEDIMERLNKTSKLLFEEYNFFTVSSQMTQKLRENDMRESLLHNLNRLRTLVENTINSYQVQASNDSENRQPFVCGSQKRPSSFETKIRERLKSLVLPPDVQTVVNEEIVRFAALDKNSAEYGMLQNYLDHLTLVPWGVYRATDTALEYARDVLNEDHFGLESVKDVILEHLAVAARMEKKEGRILCFVGPPGVGKTSIAKSIARALNREYVRVSVGGLDDVCEIKGHRRTYVGAMPGRIIKALQLSKSMDPVFCIDEVDKISTSWRGDPKSALLEVFDPEQNANFLDHFLDMPCDLSRVIFVCTANTTKSISKPLLDRMEVVHLSGYTSEEKQEIVKRYIIPSIVKSFNIGELFGTDIKLDDQVIKRITDEYFTEAGVRKTKSCIEKICRKSLKAIEMGEARQVSVTLDNLTDFAGYPDVPLRRPKTESAVGLIYGLAAIGDDMEGFRLDIECDLVKPSAQSKKVTATGLAGQALSESSMIAYLVAKKVVANIDSTNTALEENDIQLHFLEGGQEKDGPSAGIAIFSAVVSQALDIPISRSLAMTGEITLKGNVIAVGGIKQKLSAAVRTGITRVLLPGENTSQFETLPDSIKSKLDVTFVNNVAELVNVVFPQPDAKPASQTRVMQNNR